LDQGYSHFSTDSGKVRRSVSIHSKGLIRIGFRRVNRRIGSRVNHQRRLILGQLLLNLRGFGYVQLRMAGCDDLKIDFLTFKDQFST
jgi:hypothetical protein